MFKILRRQSEQGRTKVIPFRSDKPNKIHKSSRSCLPLLHTGFIILSWRKSNLNPLCFASMSPNEPLKRRFYSKKQACLNGGVRVL